MVSNDIIYEVITTYSSGSTFGRDNQLYHDSVFETSDLALANRY